MEGWGHMPLLQPSCSHFLESETVRRSYVGHMDWLNMLDAMQYVVVSSPLIIHWMNACRKHLRYWIGSICFNHHLPFTIWHLPLLMRPLHYHIVGHFIDLFHYQIIGQSVVLFHLSLTVGASHTSITCCARLYIYGRCWEWDCSKTQRIAIPLPCLSMLYSPFIGYYCNSFYVIVLWLVSWRYYCSYIQLLLQSNSRQNFCEWRVDCAR
jgi:hypothetical protein